MGMEMSRLLPHWPEDVGAACFGIEMFVIYMLARAAHQCSNSHRHQNTLTAYLDMS